jgi:hypothetical protein
MSPANCGFGLPLIAVDAALSNGKNDSNNATYNINGLQSHVHVERTQRATPPITGTFAVTYQGKTVQGNIKKHITLSFPILNQLRFDLDLLNRALGLIKYPGLLIYSSSK